MTVRELEERLDAEEWLEWIAWYELEPWGTLTEDLRAGIIAAAALNATRTRGRRARPLDFIPRRGPAPGPQSVSEIRAGFDRLRQWCDLARIPSSRG